MAAFQEIYEAYAQRVYRFLLALTGSEDMAEELLQETFYQAFLHIDKFEGRSSLYTWLCSIGKNAWMREYRRRKRFEALPPETPDTGQTPAEALLEPETLHRLRQAVYHLEEPYREVFILHTFGGLKLKDIAARFGKSESWARVTYYRAKQKLAQEVLP